MYVQALPLCLAIVHQKSPSYFSVQDTPSQLDSLHCTCQINNNHYLADVGHVCGSLYPEKCGSAAPHEPCPVWLYLVCSLLIKDWTQLGLTIPTTESRSSMQTKSVLRLDSVSLTWLDAALFCGSKEQSSLHFAPLFY